MAKLESSMKNMVLSLTVVALVASALLAGAYALTKKTIDETKRQDTEKAIKDVLADKTAQVGDAVEINLDGYKEAFIIHPATVNGQPAGAAIETYDNNGYGGKIKVMVGLTADGTVNDYAILESSETPGLGQKAAEWFRTKGDIRGKNPGKVKFIVSKDGGDIDAITASTITSRAFLRAVQCAYDAYTKYSAK